MSLFNRILFENDLKIQELKKAIKLDPSDSSLKTRLRGELERSGLITTGLNRTALRVKKMQDIARAKQQEVKNLSKNFGKDNLEPYYKAANDDWRANSLLNIANARHNLQAFKKDPSLEATVRFPSPDEEQSKVTRHQNRLRAWSELPSKKKKYKQEIDNFPHGIRVS